MKILSNIINNKRNSLWVLALIIAIIIAFSAIYYYNEVRYYRRKSIPNLTLRFIGSANNNNMFVITGKHVGPIGSIGKTYIYISKNSAKLYLVRDLFSEEDQQDYKFRFSLPKSVTSISFGPSDDIMWKAN
jgi:hypothetical protein